MGNINEFINFNEEFTENLFNALPVNVFFKNTKGEYVFCSQYWKNINVPTDDPTWTIKGKTDNDIRKDRENIEEARKADERIIKTGKPENYTIKVVNDDNTITYMELTKNPVFDKGKVVGIVGLIQDTTDKVLREIKEKEKNKIDIMTGVYNRNYYEEYIANEANDINTPFTIVAVDLNSLKYVNDTYGHDVGDEYIEKTASILKTFLPKQSKIFRIGGDEFIVIIEHTTNKKVLENIATIKLACSSIYLNEFQMSLSIGTITSNKNNNDLKELIKEADKLMYEEKAKYHKNDK